jgi:hypothetical protein
MMIEVCSQDSQTVKKNDLEELLKY